jgi:C4-dicarboxylate-specific signal transduction histidine kinase
MEYSKDGPGMPTQLETRDADERDRDDFTELQQAEAALRRTQEVYQRAISGAGAVPYEYDFTSESYRFMGAGIEDLIEYKPEEMTPALWMQIVQEWVQFGEAAGLTREEADRRVRSGQITHWRCDSRVKTRTGKSRWISDAAVQFFNEAGHPIGSVGILQDITERKQAEENMKTLHKQLLETSRQAGMAEVATSVLHNVGNVLTSVNVSGAVIADKVRKSKVANLGKAVALMQAHQGDLAGFLTGDPKGREMLGYFAALAVHLVDEQTQILQEVASLAKDIEHIKDIVAMQQNYARVSGMVEPLNVIDLVEDAIRLNAGALERHQVKVIRDYEQPVPATVDKPKLLQILVNLIRNAKYAMDDGQPPEKLMTVRVRVHGHDRVQISVMDNGVGIPAENLMRIFEHGFTTRKDGHGFGLHSGALTAKELGGSLTVQSDGWGKGATFTLEFPRQPDPQIFKATEEHG